MSRYTTRQPGTAAASRDDGNRSHNGERTTVHSARVGPLGRLGRFAYRHRWATVLSWIAVTAATLVLSGLFSGDFHADYGSPGSDSRKAQQLLGRSFPAWSGETLNVVVHADSGVEALRADVHDLLASLAKLPHVVAVDDPYQTPGGISPDGRTLNATLRLDVVGAENIPPARVRAFIDTVEDVRWPGASVAIGGMAVEETERGDIGSEGIGLVAAAIILLVVFGSLVAAGLPLLVAIAGLAVSTALGGLVTRVIDVPSWSTAMMSMIGIGIGIDYTLLMVTRFREWRAAGLDPETATVATLDTAGRAVIVAGTTLVLSMLGLFAMGLSFMRSAAVVTSISIIVVLAASVTLFPALLGHWGHAIDRYRLAPRRRPLAVPATSAGGQVEPARFWRRWSLLIQRHPTIAAIGATAIMLLLASPFLGVRFGLPDAGNSPADASARRAYDMVGAGFGPGFNGPLVLVASLAGSDAPAVLERLATTLAATDGVSTVVPPEIDADGATAVMVVIPTTGPQDQKTDDLVHRLRGTTIPEVVSGTGTRVYVGGITALNIDGMDNIARRIPLLIGGVILVSMLLLLVTFRSVFIAVKAAIMNLLSVATSYGVVAFVLDGGWIGEPLGIDTATPLASFIPVLIFAGLFGLSMDYEVFLVSRMRESWVAHGDNTRAVHEGLTGTARVIVAAAAIMIAVFAAFAPSNDISIKVIGIGMAAAIGADVVVVRLLLVPAVMGMVGRASWWLPGRLERVIPQLRVEGRSREYLADIAPPAPVRSP